MDDYVDRIGGNVSPLHKESMPAMFFGNQMAKQASTLEVWEAEIREWWDILAKTAELFPEGGPLPYGTRGMFEN